MRVKIKHVIIGHDDICGYFGTINTKSGTILFMWHTGFYPEEVTAVHNIMYNQWVTIVRDAIENDLEVELSTDAEDTNRIVDITLYNPVP